MGSDSSEPEPKEASSKFVWSYVHSILSMVQLTSMLEKLAGMNATRTDLELRQ